MGILQDAIVGIGHLEPSLFGLADRYGQLQRVAGQEAHGEDQREAETE